MYNVSVCDKIKPPTIAMPSGRRNSAPSPKPKAIGKPPMIAAIVEIAESGRPWAGVANTPRAVYAAPVITTARAHSGSQSARIGSPTLNYYWDELIQTVQLPPGVTSVTLTYWRFLDTTETSTTRVYDVFKAGLETQQGIQIVQPLQVDNTSDGRGTWVQRSLDLPNASAYSGQRIWVTFKGTTDISLPSSLYIDDVQLNVCAAQ